jgi:hypothetical protein
MPSQRGTLELFARHLAIAVTPLRAAVSDLAAFQMFARRLGWRVDDLPADYRDLAAVVDAVLDAAAALPDGADLDEVIELLAEVRRLFEALDRIDGVPAGIAPGEAATFLGELAERTFELLLCDYLVAELPVVYQAANMLGVIDAEYHRGTGTRPAFLRSRLHLDRVARLAADPGALAATVYGWNTPDFYFELVRDHVFALLWALNLSTTIEPVERALAAGYQAAPPERTDKPIESRVRTVLFEVPVDGRYVEVGASLVELPAEDGQPAGVIIQPALGSGVTGQFALDERWTLRLRTGTDPTALFGVLIRPGSRGIRFPLAPDTPPPAGGYGVALQFRPDDTVVLLGRPGGSRVEFGGATLGFRLDRVGEDLVVTADAGLDQLAVIITVGELDGFVGTVLGGRDVTLPVKLGIEWSSDGGVRFQGAAGFETAFAPGVRIGPVSVDRIGLALRAAGGTSRPRLSATVTVAVSGTLGPVGFAVDGLGVVADLVLASGNAGPLGLEVGLRGPTGLGLRLDAGPVQGGGSIGFDQPTGRYSGTFAVRFGEVEVRALALLDTRMPTGERGFSLLVMLFARFSPGFELGFGITLTGVGGLIGINRRIDVDELKQRFAAGTAVRILNPEDPVRDAPALIAELSAILPPAAGVFVVGPTVRLTWARLVQLDLGIFIELPGPTRVVLLGVANAVIRNPIGSGPLLQLRCDLVGVLDLVRSTLSVDAVLVDSRLLEVFALTGGVALRASWGAEPYALFSVGGVHPDFDPAPIVLPPTLTRLAMSHRTGNGRLSLRFEGYFAITPNTLQFGAAVEVDARIGPFTANGFIGFNTLVRFEPFHFEISFRVGMKIKFRGRTLVGVKVSGVLSGPGPVVFTGEICIEILFFDICADAKFELGNTATPPVTQVDSPLAVLLAELRDPANLHEAGGDPWVAVRPLPAVSGRPPLLPPFGLVWRQGRAPLGLLLERIEGAPVTNPETVTAESPLGVTDELDFFAPGGFAALSEAEALTRRSFERLPAGVRAAAGPDVASTAIVHDVTVREFYLPRRSTGRPPVIVADPLPAPDWLLTAVRVREGLAAGERPPPVVRVDAERWQVRLGDGTVLATDAGEAQAHQLARAAGAGAAAFAATELVSLTRL